MEIKEITDKKKWEDFFLDAEEKTFLQSWNWGEFQKEMGNKIWRFGVFENEKIVLIALVTRIKAKRGTFLLIQHGPTFKLNNILALEKLIFKIKEIGKKEKAVFLRLNPLFLRNKENEDYFKKLGFIYSPILENAYESTLKLSLSLSEEDLLKNMRKTTRYLIRQGLKNKDIVIEKSQNKDALSEYIILNENVGKRQGFVPFSFDYIKKEFQVFLKDNQALLFLGKYNNKVAAGAIVIFWNNLAFYHQAASDDKFSKLSIPYLIQWEAIKEAKKRGCLFYDFWGYVDPKENPKHPWAGPTLFKLGYNGKPFLYLKSFDLPLSKKYFLVYIFETLRRIKRRI